MDTRTTSMKPSTKGGSANGGSVRVGTLLPIVDILLGMGVDPTELLAAEGVDPKVFDDPDNQIPLTVHNRLVALAVVRSGCPHLGLLVGQRDGLHSIGLAGLLVRYSPDVETAVRSFVRYLHTHVRGAKSALTVDGDVATLNWEIYQQGVEAVDQVGDGALAVMFNILRELCGPDWKPIEVRFAHREPAQPQPFRMFFRTTLSFDAEDYSMRFAATWLQRPVSLADPALRRVLQKEIDAIEARHEADFPEQVRSARTVPITQLISRGLRKAPVKKTRNMCTVRATMNISAIRSSRRSGRACTRVSFMPPDSNWNTAVVLAVLNTAS